MQLTGRRKKKEERKCRIFIVLVLVLVSSDFEPNCFFFFFKSIIKLKKHNMLSFLFRAHASFVSLVSLLFSTLLNLVCVPSLTLPDDGSCLLRCPLTSLQSAGSDRGR